MSGSSWQNNYAPDQQKETQNVRVLTFFKNSDSPGEIAIISHIIKQ